MTSTGSSKSDGFTNFISIRISSNADSPLLCPVCPKHYRDIRDLRNHYYKIHNSDPRDELVLDKNVKPFLCKLCSKRLRQHRHKCTEGHRKRRRDNVPLKVESSLRSDKFPSDAYCKQVESTFYAEGQLLGNSLFNRGSVDYHSVFDGRNAYENIYKVFDTRVVLVPVPGDGFCFYRALALGLGVGMAMDLKNLLCSAIIGSSKHRRGIDDKLKSKLISESTVSSPVAIEDLKHIVPNMVRHNESNRGLWPNQDIIMASAVVMNIAIVVFMMTGCKDTEVLTYVELKNGEYPDARDLENVVFMINTGGHFCGLQTIPHNKFLKNSMFLKIQEHLKEKKEKSDNNQVFVDLS